MKMYILVKQSVGIGIGVVGVAHGVLMAHLRWNSDDNYKMWLEKSFRKVIVSVNDNEFELAKNNDKFLIVTESSLNNEETVLVFCPRDFWPDNFKKMRLFT